jgi:Fe2+ transport system protein FeoA
MEYRLAPTVATNIGVWQLSENEIIKANAITLADLAHDQRGEIVQLDDAVQGFTRRRFLDLGLTPGTTIYPEHRNFFDDPRAYHVSKPIGNRKPNWRCAKVAKTLPKLR